MAKGQDLCWIADWEKAKGKLTVWLVNPKLHGALVGDGPSVPFLDLCCVFYVQLFEEDSATGYIHVKHGLAMTWGKTPEQLLQQAIGNINLDEITAAPLLDVINYMLPVKYRVELKEDEAPAPIFMLSNGKAYGYGASVLVSEQIRKNLCDHFGQDMYVLPSSVHELMLVPASGKVSAQELQQLVRNTNRECVPSQERLSDSVYLLRADDASVTIAERG